MEMEFINGCCADESGRRVLDPTVYQDWQIGAAAEETLPDVETFRERLGRQDAEAGFSAYHEAAEGSA